MASIDTKNTPRNESLDPMSLDAATAPIDIREESVPATLVMGPDGSYQIVLGDSGLERFDGKHTDAGASTPHVPDEVVAALFGTSLGRDSGDSVDTSYVLNTRTGRASIAAAA